MHLLNALPQRLDPGATPTFAGLISATLTSPAATNLTLAGGAGNSSIILTPAGTGNVGIGTTSPSQLLELSKDSGYQQVLSEYSSNTSRADLVFRKARGTAASPSTTAVNDYLGIIDFSGYGSSSFSIGAELLSQVEAVGSSNYSNFIFSTRELSNNTVTERMRIANNGTVSISSTTAGSSGAGALVVAGGLATGAASYFGGAVTGLRFIASTSLIAGDFTSTNDVAIVAKSTTAVYNPEIAAFLAPSQLTYGAGAYSNVYCGVAQSAYNSGSLMFAYTGAGSTSNAFGLGMYGQLPTILINGSKQTTFAGAVTVAGTVIHTLSATPASASATGTVGTMSWDASYIYICTAANTWKRVAIATW